MSGISVMDAHYRDLAPEIHRRLDTGSPTALNALPGSRFGSSIDLTSVSKSRPLSKALQPRTVNPEPRTTPYRNPMVVLPHPSPLVKPDRAEPSKELNRNRGRLNSFGGYSAMFNQVLASKPNDWSATRDVVGRTSRLNSSTHDGSEQLPSRAERQPNSVQRPESPFVAMATVEMTPGTAQAHSQTRWIEDTLSRKDEKPTDDQVRSKFSNTSNRSALNSATSVQQSAPTKDFYSATYSLNSLPSDRLTRARYGSLSDLSRTREPPKETSGNVVARSGDKYGLFVARNRSGSVDRGSIDRPLTTDTSGGHDSSVQRRDYITTRASNEKPSDGPPIRPRSDSLNRQYGSSREERNEQFNSSRQEPVKTEMWRLPSAPKSGSQYKEAVETYRSRRASFDAPALNALPSAVRISRTESSAAPKQAPTSWSRPATPSRWEPPVPSDQSGSNLSMSRHLSGSDLNLARTSRNHDDPALAVLKSSRVPSAREQERKNEEAAMREMQSTVNVGHASANRDRASDDVVTVQRSRHDFSAAGPSPVQRSRLSSATRSDFHADPPKSQLDYCNAPSSVVSTYRIPPLRDPAGSANVPTAVGPVVSTSDQQPRAPSGSWHARRNSLPGVAAPESTQGAEVTRGKQDLYQGVFTKNDWINAARMSWNKPPHPLPPHTLPPHPPHPLPPVVKIKEPFRVVTPQIASRLTYRGVQRDAETTPALRFERGSALTGVVQPSFSSGWSSTREPVLQSSSAKYGGVVKRGDGEVQEIPAQLNVEPETPVFRDVETRSVDAGCDSTFGILDRSVNNGYIKDQGVPHFSGFPAADTKDISTNNSHPSDSGNVILPPEPYRSTSSKRISPKDWYYGGQYRSSDPDLSDEGQRQMAPSDHESGYQSGGPTHEDVVQKETRLGFSARHPVETNQKDLIEIRVGSKKPEVGFDSDDNCLEQTAEVVSREKKTHDVFQLEEPSPSSTSIRRKNIPEDNLESTHRTFATTVNSYKETVKEAFPTVGNRLENGGLKEVEIYVRGGALGVGFCIEGGLESAQGDRPITIKRVFTATADHLANKLKPGDEIVSVNGKDFRRMTHYEAWNCLKAIPEGACALLINPK